MRSYVVSRISDLRLGLSIVGRVRKLNVIESVRVFSSEIIKSERE